MRQLITKDNRTIMIRPLTAADSFSGGHGRCPVNCQMHVDGGDSPSEAFDTLNKLMIAQYDSTAILALDGQEIAGFVSFFPTWCPHYNFCDDAEIEEALAHLDAIANPPVDAEKALHIRCLAIKPAYHGNGLAVAMLEYLKQWALEHGWSTLVGNGNIYSGRAQYQWLVSPKPPVPIWEKAGFAVADFPPLNMKSVSPESSAKGARDWYASEHFPPNLPRDVAVDDPDWREIFADYTMVCRL